MKYFVTLKSATCHHPCLPIHPSVYIHEHHYVYPYTHQQYPRASLRPLFERLRQKKPKKSAKILSGNNTCVWAIPALGKSSLDRLTWSLKFSSLSCCVSSRIPPRVSSRSLTTAVSSFLLQSLRTPRKNYRLWSPDDWKHPECWMEKKIAPKLREIFFYASHWGPHHHWPLD